MFGSGFPWHVVSGFLVAVSVAVVVDVAVDVDEQSPHIIGQPSR